MLGGCSSRLPRLLSGSRIQGMTRGHSGASQLAPRPHIIPTLPTTLRSCPTVSPPRPLFVPGLLCLLTWPGVHVHEPASGAGNGGAGG